jgi:hypothetical protein
LKHRSEGSTGSIKVTIGPCCCRHRRRASSDRRLDRYGVVKLRGRRATLRGHSRLFPTPSALPRQCSNVCSTQSDSDDLDAPHFNWRAASTIDMYYHGQTSGRRGRGVRIPPPRQASSRRRRLVVRPSAPWIIGRRSCAFRRRSRPRECALVRPACRAAPTSPNNRAKCSDRGRSLEAGRLQCHSANGR